MRTHLTVTLPYRGLRYTIQLGLVLFQVVRCPINMFLLAQFLLFNERIRIKFVAHLTLLTTGKCQHGQTVLNIIGIKGRQLRSLISTSAFLL